jgi:hypothetical protein
MIITAADVVATNGAAHLSRTHPKLVFEPVETARYEAPVA